ncbi:hypothetical protein Nepgr_003000 [Nepenthes gracilis]|uniref:adenylate kinase n=1 Tax=Nepenthes gracilis TaxID=150966 RepID=A0AAD3RYP8_NEPGR|nr:hypothetical protein Nepgr_003000 [Nepenthes gracilis]
MAALSHLTAASVATGCLRSHMASAAILLIRFVRSRSYRAATAAAAKPQLDYDGYCNSYYDYENESEKRGDRVMAAADPEGSRTLRGVQWVFIGSPSARKHVYAETLSKLLDVPHISISTLVRQELSPRSFLYKQIANAVNQGKLVSESIIFGLLSKKLEDGHYRGETGFILDGIPRTRLQAEILDQLAEIDLVVNFKCSEGCFQGDRIFSDSHTSHGRSPTGSPTPDLSSKDAEPKVSRFYEEQAKFLEDYYRSQKKLLDFQVGTAPGETWKGLLAVLHLQHINAVHSSGTLPTGLSKH